MNYEKILDKTAEVFKECNITSFPIDCFSILEHYGFRVFTYNEVKLQDPILYKMCLHFSRDAFSCKDIICYDSSKIANRIRFSLMHELGHHILRHSGNLTENETEANYFASNMLAPRIVMYYEKADTADKIHNMFGLSFAASNIALSDFKNHYCRTTDALREHFNPYFHPNRKLLYPSYQKKERKISYEWEEQLQFRRTLSEIYGDDFLFQSAESQYLYGF